MTSTPRPRRKTTRMRKLLSMLLVLSVGVLATPSLAQDIKTLRKDVISAPDFRVKVAAALALGKKKDVGSLDALGNALRADENAAVRAAAAAAIGAIGDGRGVALLETARRQEKDKNVLGAIARAILQIKGKPRVVVSVGKLENKSGNPKLSGTFTFAARDELNKLPGVEVALSDSDAVAKGKAEKLPTIALDGQLVRIDSERAGGDVGYQARVEFVIRKIPEHALKATVKGNAKALAEAKSVRGAAEHSQLQAEAVTAAVQTALSSAPKAMEEAGK